MYYALIMISVIMFGGCFALNDVYRKLRGSNLKISMEFSFVGSLSGVIVLLIINGFKLEFTIFTLIMAILASINGFAFTYCSFKALGSINLSLYSLFSMLGGMVLPFFQGVIFYGEKITLAKIICFMMIFAALVLTVKKDNNKGGTIYYIGVFVLNGMSGVLSKIFASASFEKTSAAGYTMLISICSLVISGLILGIFFYRDKEITKPSGLSFAIGSSTLFLSWYTPSFSVAVTIKSFPPQYSFPV